MSKLKDINGYVATLIIPIVIVIIANIFSKAINERALEGKFVELAVKILSDTPNEESRSVRKWATDVINKYSGVPLGDVATKALIETSSITKSQNPKTSIDNPIHRVLISSLRYIFKDKLEKNFVNFNDMSSWDISKLTQMIDESKTEVTENELLKLALKINNFYINIFGAKYKIDVTQEIAVSRIKTLLQKNKGKVYDLAILLDSNYLFAK